MTTLRAPAAARPGVATDGVLASPRRVASPLVLATILVLLLAPPATTPATTPASPTEAPIEAPTEAPIAAPVADPFAPDAPIPGVPPGVDLYDETTWSELGVDDKDRMRAIRAEREYQRTGGLRPTPATPATPGDDASDVPNLERNDRYRTPRVDSWQERDGRLATATGVTGAIWAVAAVTAIVLQFAVVKAADDCIESVSDDLFGEGNDCSDELRRIRRAAAGVVVASVIAGGAGVGVLVSGITLGVHRNSRPVELSLLPLRVRF